MAGLKIWTGPDGLGHSSAKRSGENYSLWIGFFIIVLTFNYLHLDI